MNKERIIKPVSRLLVAAMLFNLAPLQLLAQGEAPSAGERRTLTSAVVIQNYRTSFDNFVREIELTREELARTDKKLGGEAESAEEVKQRLLILKTLTGKTKAVKSKVSTLEKTSRILSAVPQVRTPMKRVNKVCETSGDKLKTLEKKLKPLYKKATTVRERVLIKGLTYRYTFLKQLDKAQKIFNQNLLNKAKQTDASVTAAIYCANLNLDEDLTKLAADLNDSSEKISAFREVLKKVNDATVDTPGLLKEINIALLAFKSIDADIDVLSKLLRSISGLIKGIKNFLKSKIKFGFSKKVWGKKIGFNLKFRLSQILEGPSYLFNLIEKYLGKLLFKVAKAIGIKKIIKKFIKEAKRRVEKLLSKYKLDLDFKLDVSELDDLCARLRKLLDKLSDIFPLPDFDLSFDIDLEARLRLPHFRRLAFACASIKAVDVGITAVAAEGEAVKGVPSALTVELRDYQNMDALNTLKASKGFDASSYDRKCVLTVEAAGAEPYTEELVLAAGETRSVKIPWTPASSGVAEITVSLTTAELEADFDNNSKLATINVAPPDTDLAVLEIDTPEEIGVDGEPVAISVRASNLDAALLAEAKIKLRAGEENFESDAFLLDPAAETTVDFEWTPKQAGAAEITAEIVPLATRDTAADNNTLKTSVTVGAAGSDLSIESFEVAQEPPSADGVKLALKLTARNAGPADTAGPAKLTVTDDEGRSEEKELELKSGESKEVVFDWVSARTAGAIQFEAELKTAAEDPDEDNNFSAKTVELQTEETARMLKELDSLVKGIKGLTAKDIKELWGVLESEVSDFFDGAEGSLPRSGDLDTIRQALTGLLERLKTNYERKNKPELAGLFSRQFPDAVKLMQGIQDDNTFLRNPSLFYRIDSLTAAPDKKSAIASVHWKTKFMLPSGRFYSKTADTNMKFAQEDGEWRVAAMTNNKVFGASVFSMADLKILISALSVTPVGGNMNVSGLLLKNLGNEGASGFRVKLTYTRSGGPTYTSYASVSSLAAGSSFSGLTFTIPSVFFVPAAGDSIRLEADPDRNVPELKLNDNVLTRTYPF
ncbi:MAG: hypothetical protein RQ748_08975 [Elusimicrobiales bacterium]|nr:hypothetical protein [Elusimicrobiales bacterium]